MTNRSFKIYAPATEVKRFERRQYFLFSWWVVLLNICLQRFNIDSDGFFGCFALRNTAG